MVKQLQLYFITTTINITIFPAAKDATQHAQPKSDDSEISVAILVSQSIPTV